MAKQNYDLDTIKICRNENAEYTETEFFEKKLSMRVTTWMKLYKNLETTNFRSKMRDVSINMAQKFRNGKVYISEHGSFASKFALSAPYHYFLTTVDESESTYSQPFSVTFHEILDYTAGIIIESLHINFMVEMQWLTTEYMLAAQIPTMTILYGILLDPNNKFDIPFDIQLVPVEMPEFGFHHSKITILKYNDNNIRIIIGSANMYARDWQSRSEGLWISPLLPPLPETAFANDGESKTNFKRDFTSYLRKYKQGEVFGWEAIVQRADCSAVNVFFIGSVPGNHEDLELNLWGHKKLEKILTEHIIIPSNAENWPIVAQSSSVGVFGQNYESWILTHIVNPMSKEKGKKNLKFPDFKFIFPSQNNYCESYDSKVDVTCLMYDEETYLKQLWFKDYLYQWKSDKVERTRAMPHLKCYTRISPDQTEIAWFLLTSANLSKGAWGKLIKQGTCQFINNYEAGVLFIPQFVINRATFPVLESNSSEVPVFLLPFDLPLTPYGPNDEPFIIKKSHEPKLDLELSHTLDETSNLEENIDNNDYDLEESDIESYESEQSPSPREDDNDDGDDDDDDDDAD